MAEYTNAEKMKLDEEELAERLKIWNGRSYRRPISLLLV